MTRTFVLAAIVLGLFGESARCGESHVWTQRNGDKLHAEFVGGAFDRKRKAFIVILQTGDGERVSLPVAELDLRSKDLAIRLAGKQKSGRTKPASESTSTTTTQNGQSTSNIARNIPANIGKVDRNAPNHEEIDDDISDKPGEITLDDLDGKAFIVSSDGEFLGLISSDPLGEKSITNDLSRHGSDLSPTSIFNDFGRYGGEISVTSPWNDIATRPPRVYLGKKFLGYLSTNSLKTPRIDPFVLVGYFKAKAK